MGVLRIPHQSEIMTVAQSKGSRSAAPWAWREAALMMPMQDGRGNRLARDVATNNHGTLTNGPTWVTTEKGWALDTAGGATNEGISHAEINLGQTHTIAYWAATDAYEDGFWGKATTHYCFWHFNTTESWYRCNDGATGRLVKLNHTATVAGKFHHYVARRSGTAVEMYLDGQLEDSDVLGSSADMLLTNIANQATWDFDGRFCLVAAWERLLAVSEITALYVDPWAPHRLFRRTVFPAAVVGAIAPTAVLSGSLVGPLGGPV